MNFVLSLVGALILSRVEDGSCRRLLPVMDAALLRRSRPAARRSFSSTNMPATTAPGSRRCGILARRHRCVTFSQRGYPPSDVPSDPNRIQPEHRPRRRDRADGRAEDQQSARRRPLDGRVYGAACRHEVSGPLPLGDSRRLRLGLEARPEGARGDEGDGRRDRQDVHRAGHRESRRRLCRRADAPGAQEQGSARLGRVRQDAVRAFGATATRTR